jgi:flagellar L-ring protein FlgH
MNASFAAPLFAILSLLSTSTRAGDESRTMFDENSYRSLVAETKAAHVGDVLTVVVQESASATSTTDLRAQRDFNAGVHLQLTAIRHRSPLEHAVTGGTTTGSDGAGSTQRTGNLLAQLSVRVLQVRANGDLVVSGQQGLKINGEEQLITLSGVVRPTDVAADNTVLSNRIADARIQFDGEGFVTEQSKPGVVAKILNFLGF